MAGSRVMPGIENATDASWCLNLVLIYDRSMTTLRQIDDSFMTV